MKTQKLTGVILMAFLSVCCNPATQATDKTASNKAQTAHPPQNAVTEVTPITFVPQIDKSGRIAGMGQQWFFYDAKAQKAATPDGPTLKAANSIIPIRMLSFNSSAFAGTMCYVYKDILIDLKNIQDRKSFPLAVIQVNDDQQLVSVAVQGHKNLLIDDNYTVFADDSRVTSPDAPSLTIHLIATRLAGKTHEPIPALRGVLERGGGRKQKFETGKDGDTDLVLEDVDETTVVAVATDANGEKVEMPIPLPMKGATDGLVTQLVILEFGKHKDVK